MSRQSQCMVYFDWGGVIRSLHDDEMFDDIAMTCRVPRRAVDAIWKDLGPQLTRAEISEVEFWTRLARENLIALPDGYNDLFTRVYREKSRLNQPVIDLLDRLKGAGYMTGLLSNTTPVHMDFFFKNPAWSQYGRFNPIVASPMASAKKGDEGHRIYQVAEGLVQQKTIFFADDQRSMPLTSLQSSMLDLMQASAGLAYGPQTSMRSLRLSKMLSGKRV